jgi:glutamate/tyrosine decarboxylase-like PLP-dependent enzyme
LRFGFARLEVHVALVYAILVRLIHEGFRILIQQNHFTLNGFAFFDVAHRIKCHG